MPVRFVLFAFVVLPVGCAIRSPVPNPFAHNSLATLPPSPTAPLPAEHSTVQPVRATTDPVTPTSSFPSPTPAYASNTTLPIDLPTVFRLVNENSPAVGFARARYREALARQDKAELLWLPHLQGGVTYNRFDGQTQNQAGVVFGVSRANLFGGGGSALVVDTADAVYQPLVARQVARAEAWQSHAATLTAQLNASLAYWDLVHIHALLAVNSDTLTRAEQMLKYSQDAKASQLSKTAGDVNRAQTEVYLRTQERYDLEARAGAAAARLGQLLLLDPAVVLVPAESAAIPVELIDPSQTLDHLITIALAHHPDLAVGRSQTTAAEERVRKARFGPLLPKVGVTNTVGSFGGGTNADVSQFAARNVLALQLYWEVQNLGFGNAANVRAEQAAYDQNLYQLAETRARVSATVAEAARVAGAKAAGLVYAQKATDEATELYRKLRETSFNMVGPRAQYDALEPLLAIQAIHQARTQYLAAVFDYNRAQFRLFSALGYPADCSTPALR